MRSNWTTASGPKINTGSHAIVAGQRDSNASDKNGGGSRAAIWHANVAPMARPTTMSVRLAARRSAPGCRVRTAGTASRMRTRFMKCPLSRACLARSRSADTPPPGRLSRL